MMSLPDSQTDTLSISFSIFPYKFKENRWGGAVENEASTIRDVPQWNSHRDRDQISEENLY